jgi:hypothetical protein
MIPIKYHLNIDYHENYRAYCIRCKDLILFTRKKQSTTYFDIHNFKISYIVFLYLLEKFVSIKKINIVVKFHDIQYLNAI